MTLIKDFESCSLTAYQDQGGRWTIGWGCTGGIKPGEVWTQDQCDTNLLCHVRLTEQIVLAGTHGREINENQFSALVSFVYNVGCGRAGADGKDGFIWLKNGDTSTMRQKLLAGDFAGAAGEFEKWDKIGDRVIQGLLRRRLAERDLFLRPVAAATDPAPAR